MQLQLAAADCAATTCYPAAHIACRQCLSASCWQATVALAWLNAGRVAAESAQKCWDFTAAALVAALIAAVTQQLPSWSKWTVMLRGQLRASRMLKRSRQRLSCPAGAMLATAPCHIKQRVPAAGLCLYCIVTAHHSEEAVASRTAETLPCSIRQSQPDKQSDAE